MLNAGVNMILNTKIGGKIFLRKEINKKNYCYMVSWLFLGIVFVLNLALLKYGSDKLIDSDISSELVLAKLMSDEGSIISSNWFYSTELRIIAAQLIYAPLAKLFTDWTVWRFASCIVSCLFLCVTYYFLCIQLKIEEYFPITMSLMLIPYSWEWFYALYLSLYYTPYIIIAFLAIGLMIATFRQKNSKTVGVLLCFQVLLAIFAGMAGFREVVQLYFPCFVAMLLHVLIKIAMTPNQNSSLFIYFRLLLLTFVNLLFSCVGLLINIKILSEYFDFQKWGGIIEWKSFDLDSLVQVFNGIFNVFGFSIGVINVYSFVKNILTIILIFLTILMTIYLIQKKELAVECKFFVEFFVINLSILFLLFCISTMSYIDRYNLPITVMLIPILGIGLKEYDRNHVLKKIGVIVLSLLSVVSGLITFNSLKKIDKVSEFEVMKEILIDDGYLYGFADFWEANILTEVSNGEIDMRCFGNWMGDMSMCTDVTLTYNWLQLKRHVGEVPENKVFIIFTTEGYNTFYAKSELDTIMPIYESERYKVVGFENYTSMLKILSNYTFIFDGSRKWLLNGTEENGRRIIYSGGLSYGPYKTLEVGTYVVEIAGNNLELAEIYCTHSNSMNMLELHNLDVSDSLIRCYINVEEVLNNVEIRIFNNSEENIELKSISIINNKPMGVLGL